MTHQLLRHDAPFNFPLNWLSLRITLWCVMTHHLVRHDAQCYFAQFCTILLCIFLSFRTSLFVCPFVHFTVDLKLYFLQSPTQFQIYLKGTHAYPICMNYGEYNLRIKYQVMHIQCAKSFNQARLSTTLCVTV
jgi:hypothetical protein